MASTQNTNDFSTTTRGENNKNTKGPELLNKTRVRCLELVLRVLALVLTLVAAILVGVDKQTKVIQLSSNPLPVSLQVHAKWHYLSAFVYLVVTNSIACGYAAISLILALAGAKSGHKGLALVIAALDLVVVALLFSGIGAAGAIGQLGYNGNSHVQWNKVCNVFGRFCSQLAAGIALSFVGSIGFLFLVLISLFKFQNEN